MLPILQPFGRLALDYGAAAGADSGLPGNLSGIAAAGDLLWTVKDEGRTLEELARDGDGFAWQCSHDLDQLFLDRLGVVIPGADDPADPDELDLESLDFHAGRLWLCGSHSSKRKKKSGKIRHQPSRNLLAALDIGAGGKIGTVRCLPFEGAGSLLALLGEDELLRPFMALAAKENGFDIEGCAADGDELLLGLRGPVVDDLAVVVRLALAADLRIERYELARLDLDGLGVRDLARAPDGFYVLAGPVCDARGGFRLYRWSGARGDGAQRPDLLAAFPDRDEKPEGIALLDRGAGPSLAVVYDSRDSDDGRVSGTRYAADLFDLSPFQPARPPAD